jgi:hypothetical protein
MAESVDAVDLKSADRKVVGVQVSLPPLHYRSVFERLSSNDLTLNRFYLLKTYSKANLAESRRRVNREHIYPNYLSAQIKKTGIIPCLLSCRIQEKTRVKK